MSKTLSFLVTAVISLLLYASAEAGTPVASYYSDCIILPNGDEIPLSENAVLLFLNGALIYDYEVIIRDDRALVPLRLIAQELGASVEWDGASRAVTISKAQNKIILTIDDDRAFVNETETALDYPAIIYKDLTYVPLRLVAEGLDASVEYSSWAPSEYTYYYDTKMPVSPANTIVRSFANIIIDEKYDFGDCVTAEEAMKNTQEICLYGLESFSKSIRESLSRAGEPPDRLDADLESIKREINRMRFIGEVSRFYKLTIGPYDILYDRADDKVFFVIYSSGTIIKEVDVYDKGLYIPVFIVG